MSDAQCQPKTWCVQRWTQGWNPDAALFSCSCLIFHMLQSHMFEERLVPWAETLIDASELSAAAYPGCFEQIHYCFGYSTCMAPSTHSSKERRMPPACLLFHDELFPGSNSWPHSFFAFGATAERLFVFARWRWWTVQNQILACQFKYFPKQSFSSELCANFEYGT